MLVNARPRRALGSAPADRITADKAAMLALPPGGPRPAGPGPLRAPGRQRLLRPPGRDRPSHRGHRRPGPGPRDLRRPGCGRSRADLGLASDDHRPAHHAAAKALRRQRAGVLRPVGEPDVEQRDLAGQAAFGDHLARASVRVSVNGQVLMGDRQLEPKVDLLIRADLATHQAVTRASNSFLLLAVVHVRTTQS